MPKPQRPRPKDEIAEDIRESLRRRGIFNEELLRELLITFAYHLGQEKALIDKEVQRELERRNYKH